MPRRPPIRDDLLHFYREALRLSVLAAVPLALLGIASAIKAVAAEAPPYSFRSWVALVATVAVVYASAATCSAITFWLARPIRRGLLGYLAMGAIVAPVLFASAALVGYLAWASGGQLLFGRFGASRRIFLQHLPVILAGCAALGSLIGAADWAHRRRPAA